MILRVALILVLLAASTASAQAPNAWHPYRGGTNCIQVADSRGNFNCAGGTTVNPTTGDTVIGGTLSFSTAALALQGLILTTSPTTLKTNGSGDMVMMTSPVTVAPSGPGGGGAVVRVRRGPAGSCQLVVAGGNNFGEFVIPVLDALGRQVETFPGGYRGC